MDAELQNAPSAVVKAAPARDAKAVRDLLHHFGKRLNDGESMAQIFEISEETLQLMEAQAYELYLKEQFDKAQIAALGLLALDRERLVSRLIAGDIALREFRFREAMEHLKAAHQMAPSDVAIQARLGEACAKAGNLKAARHHLEAVLKAEGGGTGVILRAKGVLTALNANKSGS